MDLSTTKIEEIISIIEYINSVEFKKLIKESDKESEEIKNFEHLDAVLKKYYYKSVVVEKKIAEFNETVLKYAQHDYSVQNRLDSENDSLNSLGLSINLLGEELNFSTVTTYYLNDIFNSMKDMLIVIDKQGNILSVNNVCTSLLNYKSSDLLNKSINKILEKEIDFDKLINGNFSLDINIFISRYKNRIPVMMSVSHFVRGDEQKIGTVIIAKDMTAKLKAEEALQRSEMNFRKLYESTSDAVMLLNKNGFFDCNNATLKLFGCKTKEEFYKLHPADVSPLNQPNGTTSIELVNNHIDLAIEKGSLRFDWLHKRFDTKEEFPAEVLLTAMDFDGKTILQAVVRDISERKRTEEKLRKNEEQFRQMFDRAPLGYQSLNIDGYILDVNQKWLDTLGYKKEEVIGKWFGDFLLPQYKDVFEERFPFFIEKGNIYSEFEMKHKDGSSRFIAFDGNVGTDINGKFKQTHCILKDITDRKQAEEQLLESNRKINFLVNNLRGVAYRCKNDSAWTMEYISGGIYELAGYNSNDFINNQVRTFDSIIVEEDRRMVSDVINNGIKKKETYTLEYRILTSENQQKWVWERGCGVFENDVLLALEGFISDVTDRKQAEKTLEESEDRFRAVSEYSHNAICILNEQGRIIWVNAAMIKMGGYTVNQLYEADSFISFLAPESIDFVLSNFTKFVNKENYEHNLRFYIIRADGEKRLFEKHMTDFISLNGSRNLAISMIDITESELAAKLLDKKIKEMEIFNELAVNRELKMIELKKEINSLLLKIGEKEKYR